MNHNIFHKHIEKINCKQCEALLVVMCIFSSIMMFVRCFWGIDITDEAFYLADALHMLHGNVPYAYNFFSYGTGSAFLLIPQILIYEWIVPDLTGVVLFSRLSFTMFRLLVIGVVYCILRKRVSRINSLLITGVMIPFWGSIIQNYSYNSIPCYLCFLTTFFIYDAIENKSKYAFIELMSAGFIIGISVFAHPGYGLAVILFLILIPIRAQKDNWLQREFAFVLGGMLEILVVFVPIIMQVGFGTLVEGIDVTLFHPFPSGPSSAPSKMVLLERLKPFFLQGMKMLLVACVLALFYFKIRRIKISIKEKVLLIISLYVIESLLYIIYKYREISPIAYMGVIAVICEVFLLCFRMYSKDVLIVYLGIYPIVFSFGLIYFVASGANYERLFYAFVVLIPIFLLGLNADFIWTRYVTVISVLLCMIIVGYRDYEYVYRDEAINKLNVRVESGIYKNLYTTSERANDVQQLEEYLDSVIEAGEVFAFRDNVPVAYLMTNQGTMCDIATWDGLMYAHGQNAPAKLFAYYKRRNMIPEKIVYVDYGVNEQLSIEDKDNRYNDFVNTYYDLESDIRLNDTFYHVIVYEYNGSFDGNFDYWIDKYYELVS